MHIYLFCDVTMMNGDDDSSSDDEFMSPFASLRATFPTPKCESETLTSMRNDTSFLGARVSPVIAFDDEPENEDRDVIAPFRQALHESMDSSFSNERTSLLGRRSVSKSTKQDEDSVHRKDDNDKSSRIVAPTWSWGIILCTLSGIHFGCMAIHDLYIWYLWFRLGRGRQNVAWRLPLLSPSINTLTRFGAYVPSRVLDGQAWRILTSLFMSTSLVEFIFMCGAWYALQVEGLRPSFKCVLLFVTFSITGQLWAMAWDSDTVSGVASWGTSGILCAAGVGKPRKRCLLLVICMSLIAISLIDASTDSIMGTLGSSLFGCACCGMGCNISFCNDEAVVKPPEKSIRIFSGIILLLQCCIPILWIIDNNTVVGSQTTNTS